jgi:hypothetical protein
MISPPARAASHPLLILLELMALWCVPRDGFAQPPAALALSAGYAVVRDPTSDLNFPVGWTAGADGAINTWLSAVAELGDHHKTIATAGGDLRFGVRTFMAGGKASTRIGKAIEFGQLLVGAVRGTGDGFGVRSSSTRLAAQVGGGVDFPIATRLAVRGEIDFRVVKSAGGGSGRGRQFRGLTAIVYRVF